MALSQTEGDFLVLHEFIQAAHKKLDRNIWDYLVGATATETTLLRNRLAIDRLAFRPRVLRDVSSISARHNFFGTDTRLPVVLAPIGGLEARRRLGGACGVELRCSLHPEFGVGCRDAGGGRGRHRHEDLPALHAR
jgi:isopentenyl diphosphate isomerase/L-lactate dehydrogenase-like FMN-dependent dehydrogenase